MINKAVVTEILSRVGRGGGVISLCWMRTAGALVAYVGVGPVRARHPGRSELWTMPGEPNDGAGITWRRRCEQRPMGPRR